MTYTLRCVLVAAFSGTLVLSRAIKQDFAMLTKYQIQAVSSHKEVKKEGKLKKKKKRKFDAGIMKRWEQKKTKMTLFQ